MMPNDTEDVKLIGVYGSRAAAVEAVERRRQFSGFSDFPVLLDSAGVETSGFHISEPS